MNEIFPIAPAPTKTLWILGFLALLVLVIFFLTIYIGYSSQQVQFELSATELQIEGDPYGKSIPIADLSIERAKKIDLSEQHSYRPKWRTNGIGLPGYHSGWFRLENGEKALLWVTNSKNVIYIPTTRGYSLLMSPKNPDEFFASLRRKLPENFR